MTKSMVIYLLTDNTNGKQYVGQTRRKLYQRIKQHKSKMKSLVGQAIKTNGWENFSVELLDELNEREIYWIATLNTKYPNGYNLTNGGDGTVGHKQTQEVKDKISATLSQKSVLCVETRMFFSSIKNAAIWAGVKKKMIYYACKKSNHTAGGYHWIYRNEPMKNEESITLKKIYRGRPVLCIETGVIFPSIKTAAIWVGANDACIAKVCNKNKKTVGGFHWEYSMKPFNDENFSEKLSADEVRQQLGIENFCRNTETKRPVFCVESGKIFDSLTEAAEWANVNVSSICCACKKDTLRAGSYHWKYVD